MNNKKDRKLQGASEIIDDIDKYLENNFIYNKTISLGLFSDVKKLIKDINKLASKKNIIVSIKYDDTLLLDMRFNIRARYDNIFMKFFMAEKYFYNKIVGEKVYFFEFNENSLNTLYILHALQTAFYHAGCDEGFVIINNKRYRIEPKNMVSRYRYKIDEKVISVEEQIYKRKLEREHNIRQIFCK